MATVFTGVVVARVQNVPLVMLRMESIMQGTEIQCVADTLEELVEEQGVRKLVIDFRAVYYFSSKMLSVLIDLNRRINALQGRLVLLGVHPRLQELFRITGIYNLFTFAPTEQLALQFINTD
ncbi:MAG: STAS domain-containing protein [Phycisphaerae bacterium]|nr:STAS domain-containing protein [Phycisphaerae bacterium]